MITGRTQEDDVKAQKAAARALEMAFLKKKERENHEAKISEPEPPVAEAESVPVPAKRQSVRKVAEEKEGR